MQYPSYAKYKDVNIDWLKELPEEWSKIRAKFILKFLSGDGFPHELQGVDKGDYPFLKVSDISFPGKDVSTASNYVNKQDVVDRKWKIIKKDSILMPKIGEALKLNHRKILKTNALIDNNTLALSVSSQNIDVGYLYYLSLILDMKWIVNPGAVPSVNMDGVRNLWLPIPGDLEQQNIAAFLDYKTQQIDQLIVKKKALIEKLNEQRIAVITQAVTKGLDKNAKMKPSGVDWLGNVPDHWEVKRLRFCVISNPLKSEIKELEDEDLVSFVPMEAVKEYGGMDLSQTRMLDDVYNGYTYFKENDVVVAKITPCFENGKGSIATCLKNGIGFGTTEFHVLRGLESMDEEYLFYLTISYPFRKNGEAIMVGAGGHKRISEDYVKNYCQGIPEKEEQREIVKYIKTRLIQIDKMVEVNKQIVERYEEYRSALITDAVTGKIDVRDVEWNKEVS